MLKNKKGYSTGFTWVFGLVSLFGLGIMYIVFSQVFIGNLVPIIKDLNNASGVDNATKAVINANIDQYMVYFNTLPYVLFFVIVLYMIFAAIRKEREEAY